MSPRQLAAFRLDPELVQGLEFVAERDGIAVSDQVRLAIEKWLSACGVPVTKGSSFAANRERVDERWTHFIDLLDIGPPETVPIPVGLSPFVSAGKEFGQLTDEEVRHLAKFGADLERDVMPLRRAWQDVKKRRERKPK